MNAEITKQWEKNKEKYRDVLKRSIVKRTFKYEYQFLLSVLIVHVINKDREESYKDLEYDLDPESIHMIQVGEWNGDNLFVIKPTYSYCSMGSLWLTKVFFGSCSGCDEMLGAEYCEDPEEKVDILMKISLELIEEFNPLKKIYPI